ncbi:MAG: hypothetical protein S4CHLAM20_04060 [Chlamydiia bacterium]|nr:hypothetical protein [Chlamydiia bacterium]
MKWKFWSKESSLESNDSIQVKEREYSPSAVSSYIGTIGYDGEKTPGEIGNIKRYIPEFRRLRLRSWQSFFESEITQDVINKFVIWSVGSGLRLQAEPVRLVLQSNGVSLSSDFNREVETRFALYAKSEESDYSSVFSLNKRAAECKKNAIVSGDCLVILRVDTLGNVKVQLVDGEHLQNPFFGSRDLLTLTRRGNSVSHGIEKNSKGKHVAYWVVNKKGEIKRISARDRSGNKRAYLVYGSKYRLDHDRGMPLISVVLETLKKLDRYKEATVASAEERAKIVYAFEHDKDAIGSNPIQSHVAESISGTKVKTEDDSFTVVDNEKANIALTTEKSIINLPPGAKIVPVSNDNDLNYEGFYRPNVDMICAAIGIPPEVALSKYDSNFSASRAALKDWENTLNVDRFDFSVQFYQPIYALWLSVQIAMGKIKVSNYDSYSNEMINALNNARWIGTTVPHIDPLKEVKAEREKLGVSGKSVPLTTAERAIETLGGGDYETIARQYSEELKLAPKPEQKNKNGE